MNGTAPFKDLKGKEGATILAIRAGVRPEWDTSIIDDSITSAYVRKYLSSFLSQCWDADTGMRPSAVIVKHHLLQARKCAEDEPKAPGTLLQ